MTFTCSPRAWVRMRPFTFSSSLDRSRIFTFTLFRHYFSNISDKLIVFEVKEQPIKHVLNVFILMLRKKKKYLMLKYYGIRNIL